MAKRPNVVLIMTDQQRGDALGCAWPAWREGRPALTTPNLDRPAADGVRFDRAYVNHPICMPSRATLLTGLPCRGHGVRTNGINLDPRLPTLPGTLRAAGYRTRCVGKIHGATWELPWGLSGESLDPVRYPEAIWMWEHGKLTGFPPDYCGFERVDFVGGHGPWMWGEYRNWLAREHPDEDRRFQWNMVERPVPGLDGCMRLAMDPAHHYNAWIADRSIGALEDFARGEAPFFLQVSFPDPHGPFAAPEPWYSRFPRDAVPPAVTRAGEEAGMAPHVRNARKDSAMPDAHRREIAAVTDGMIAFVDEQIGRVLAAVDRLGLREDTAVCFLSDHGEMLGDHGLFAKGPYPYDGINRVPLIWRFQQRFPEGRVTQALVSHLDFVPTVLDLAGVAQPEFRTVPDPAKPGSALTRLPGRSLLPVLSGEQASVNDAAVIEYDVDGLGLRMRTLVTDNHQLTIYVGDDGERPYGDLFNLAADPGQTVNRWTDPGCAGIKADLRGRLAAELIRTDSRYPLQHTDF